MRAAAVRVLRLVGVLDLLMFDVDTLFDWRVVLADLVVVLTGFVVVLIGCAVILVDFVVALTGFGVDLASCVVGLVGFVVGLGDFWGLREEDTPDLALRVFSPSIDLFESIIYNYNMKVQKITKKQQAVLNFLEDFTEENGYSPSYREIMTGLGLSSVSAVAEHIDNMVSKGILKKVPGAARSLEVLDFRHTETVELFKNRLGECTEEEKKVLMKAAEILGLDLSTGLKR